MMARENRWLWAGALLAALGIAFADAMAGGAGPTPPGEPNWQTARFPTASAVTVDVIEVTSGGGTQIGNDRATVRLNADSSPSETFAIDLATVPGYATNCTPRTYVLRWAPDGANCTSTPTSCAISTAQVGGASCSSDPRVQEIRTYASGVVAGQGITQELLEHYARRGERPLRWREIRHASDGDFSAPEATEWEVFSYRRGPTWPEVACTVRTTTNPASALPSFAACQ